MRLLKLSARGELVSQSKDNECADGPLSTDFPKDLKSESQSSRLLLAIQETNEKKN